MHSEATIEPLPISVYGTLMMGQPTDFMWQECARTVEAARVDNCCLNTLGHYPVMIEDAGRKVLGQLVCLENEHFWQIVQNLDYLEGYDPGQPQESNFWRVQVRALTRAGQRVVAWT